MLSVWAGRNDDYLLGFWTCIAIVCLVIGVIVMVNVYLRFEFLSHFAY